MLRLHNANMSVPLHDLFASRLKLIEDRPGRALGDVDPRFRCGADEGGFHAPHFGLVTER